MELFNEAPPLILSNMHPFADSDELEGGGDSKSIGGVGIFRTAIQLTVAGVGLWYLYDTFASLPESYRLAVMVVTGLVLSWIGYKIYDLIGKHIASFLSDAVPWF